MDVLAVASGADSPPLTFHIFFERALFTPNPVAEHPTPPSTRKDCLKSRTSTYTRKQQPAHSLGPRGTPPPPPIYADTVFSEPDKPEWGSAPPPYATRPVLHSHAAPSV